MERPTIKVKEGTELYNTLISEFNSATDDDLLIVARGKKNKKGDHIKPVEVKNDIYFYLAKKISDEKIAFIGNYTVEDVARAKANTIKNARIGSVDFFLSLILEKDDDEDAWSKIDDFEYTDQLMIMVSNGDKTDGAGILLCDDYLKALQNKIGKFFILPSSIHEILIIKDDGMVDMNNLSAMVKEVNRTQVSDEDVLADTAYKVSYWI